MPPPSQPSLASIFRELRWLNGWFAAFILIGFPLALLEVAGFGVTSSAPLAFVEGVASWLVAMVIALGCIVSRPQFAMPESVAREFFANFCGAAALVFAVIAISYVARPAFGGEEPASWIFTITVLLALAAALACLGIITGLLFGRAVKWSLARDNDAPRRGFLFSLGEFLLHTWRTRGGAT